MEHEPITAGARYDHFDDSPGSTHNLVVSLIPQGAKVLEFGCATGYMSALLRERLAASVTGIEIDRRAADAAAAAADRVIVGDAEQLNLEELLEGERFDVVVFADVLEHLKDPGSLLARVRPFLGDEGTIVASIPNVSHGSLRLALLAGEFRYRESGLLDEGHLRFFTRATVQDLFEEAGYVVTHWLRRRVDVDAGEIVPPRGLEEAAREWLAADPEATTYQFVIQAVPSDAADRLVALRRQLTASELEIERLRVSVEAARQEAEARSGELAAANAELEARAAAAEQELETLRHAHDVQSKRLVAERIAMTDHVTALERQLDTLHRSRSFRYTQPFRSLFRSIVPRQ